MALRLPQSLLHPGRHSSSRSVKAGMTPSFEKLVQVALRKLAVVLKGGGLGVGAGVGNLFCASVNGGRDRGIGRIFNQFKVGWLHAKQAQL